MGEGASTGCGWGRRHRWIGGTRDVVIGGGDRRGTCGNGGAVGQRERRVHIEQRRKSRTGLDILPSVDMGKEVHSQARQSGPPGAVSLFHMYAEVGQAHVHVGARNAGEVERRRHLCTRWHRSCQLQSQMQSR